MNIKDKNIVVPMDFRPQAEEALKQAVNIAKVLNHQIVLLYVHQEKGVLTSIFSKEQTKLFDNAVIDKMTALAKEIADKSGVDIQPVLLHNNSIHTAIVEFTKTNNSELIVMGRGVKGEQSIIGANTSRVLRYSKVPVITVTCDPNSSQSLRNILLPLDLTKETRQKVNWGITLAKLFGGQIKVVSALWDKNNENIVGQLKLQMAQVENFIKKKGVKCTTEIVEASADAKTLVPIIIKYVETQGDIDLILLMTQQEIGFTEFFMGSYASEVIRKAKVPVMSIIPHDTGQIIWGI